MIKFSSAQNPYASDLKHPLILWVVNRNSLHRGAVALSPPPQQKGGEFKNGST